jgi:hypothetical protein
LLEPLLIIGIDIKKDKMITAVGIGLMPGELENFYISIGMKDSTPD